MTIRTDKPTVVLDGAHVKIDGEEFLVLVLQREYPQPGLKTKVSDQVWSIMDKYNVVMCARHEDGTYGFAVSDELSKKLHAKLGPGYRWRKIMLYPAD
jgi:hypothetical protein